MGSSFRSPVRENTPQTLDFLHAALNMSVSGPGMVTAVANISSRSYMIPCVLYSGNTMRSMPGRPAFMPSILLQSPSICVHVLHRVQTRHLVLIHAHADRVRGAGNVTVTRHDAIEDLRVWKIGECRSEQSRLSRERTTAFDHEKSHKSRGKTMTSAESELCRRGKRRDTAGFTNEENIVNTRCERTISVYGTRFAVSSSPSSSSLVQGLVVVLPPRRAHRS